MRDHDQEVVREFLIESHENLSRLDQELVELERRPGDSGLLASIFRTIHTIKGTCGFLGFSTLERVTHQTENLLSQLRDGQRELTPPLISLILEALDATRQVLKAIETSGQEGPEQFAELTERLQAATKLPTPGGTSARNTAPTEQRESARTEVARTDDEGARAPAITDSNIRVGVGLLDKLMDLVGELVLTRNQILQFTTEREDPALNATSQRLNLITSELQEGVMKTRMQPIGMVWNKLPRVVRDMAVALGKQIRLDMEGTETELDRNIIEAIKDPLVHLVRNSCDHGIEPAEVRVRAGKPAEGRLVLKAYHEGGQVNIEITDDGAGVNLVRVRQKAIERGMLRPEQADTLSERETLNLILQPGFSTAATVTNVSGRGVGMDVVKSQIEKTGGIVDISSRAGEGTTVKLKIPLTLAIIPGLVITSGGERFVIPQVSLLELIRLDGDSSGSRIEYVHGTPVYRRRGGLLPVTYLDKVLGLDGPARSEEVSMVVLQAEDRQFGLVVDGINDTQEIVVKPLSKQLKGLSIYAGATIMGDGRVALILDVLGVGQRSGVLSESREQSRAAAEQKAAAENERQRLLLFGAGSFERLAVPLALVARLEEFPRSALERAGGYQVVQYGDRILPLIPLRSVLGEAQTDPDQEPDVLQAVVFQDGDRSIGVVVDQIVDIVEESVSATHRTHHPGLLGSGVVGRQVTDFLDLNYVINVAAKDWMHAGSGGDKRVLVADGSAFSRGLIRGGLDMAGYRVVEASNVDEAIRKLESQPVDVVVTALNLPPRGGSELLAALRRRPEWEAVPVLGLADSAEQVRNTSLHGTGYQEFQVKFDREAMLESVTRLASALAAPTAEPVFAGRGN